jgi:hypothetical protein
VYWREPGGLADSNIAVSVGPGHTALTRTPWRPRLAARDRTNPSSPALAAQ